jgi:hypothetical protein
MNRILCLSLGFMAVACGNNKGKSPDGGGGGAGGSGDMTHTGPVPDLASGDLSQGPPAPLSYTRRGLVNIINEKTGTAINAHFWDFPAGACTATQFGPCELDVCAAGTTPSAELDAGTIMLGGGTTPESLTFSGTAYMVTPPIGAGTINWPVGATASVNAAGKTVAAFATTVTIPTGITALTTPALNPAPTIPRDQDFVVAWTGGSGQFLVELVKDTRIGPSLLCSFPAVAQTGTVPKAALSALAAGTYELELFTSDLKTVTISNGFVHVAGASFFNNVSVTLP